jgi:hypothetical protein
MNYLPSTKFLLIVFVLLLVGGGLTLWVKQNKDFFADKRTPATYTGSTAGVTFEGQDNVTVNVSRELIEGFMRMEQRGTVMDEEAQQEFFEDLVLRIQAKAEAKKYAIGDLRAIQGADHDQIYAYGDRFMEIVADHPDLQVRNEVEVLMAYIEEGDQFARDVLRDRGDQYYEVAEKMIALEVPQEVALKHLALVNNFYLIGRAIHNMSSGPNDPVRSLTGINGYVKNIDEQRENALVIQAFLDEQGVVYPEDAAGYAWHTI